VNSQPPLPSGLNSTLAFVDSAVFLAVAANLHYATICGRRKIARWRRRFGSARRLTPRQACWPMSFLGVFRLTVSAVEIV